MWCLCWWTRTSSTGSCSTSAVGRTLRTTSAKKLAAIVSASCINSYATKCTASAAMYLPSFLTGSSGQATGDCCHENGSWRTSNEWRPRGSSGERYAVTSIGRCCASAPTMTAFSTGEGTTRVVPSNGDTDALWISWFSANRLGARNVLCHCSFVVPVVDKPID